MKTSLVYLNTQVFVRNADSIVTQTHPTARVRFEQPVACHFWGGLFVIDCQLNVCAHASPAINASVFARARV